MSRIDKARGPDSVASQPAPIEEASVQETVVVSDHSDHVALPSSVALQALAGAAPSPQAAVRALDALGSSLEQLASQLSA